MDFGDKKNENLFSSILGLNELIPINGTLLTLRGLLWERRKQDESESGPSIDVQG